MQKVDWDRRDIEFIRLWIAGTPVGTMAQIFGCGISNIRVHAYVLRKAGINIGQRRSSPKKGRDKAAAPPVARVTPLPVVAPPPVVVPPPKPVVRFADANPAQRLPSRAPSPPRARPPAPVIRLAPPERRPPPAPVGPAPTCQWLEGDAKLRNFCGEKSKPGSSFCARHHARCYYLLDRKGSVL